MQGDRREFSGKHVVVTGGTRGIGHAIACAFVDQGAEVTVTGTREEADYPVDLSGLLFIRADAMSEPAAAEVARAMPHADVLVNNAGIVLYKKQEFEIAQFRRVIEVNLISAMIWSMAFYNSLKARRGTIVNIGSLAGQLGARGNPAYAASKGGLDALTKSLALAWGRDGIRVNAVAPGFIETDMTKPSLDDAGIREAARKRTPLGRWGTPEEVAGAVLSLASTRSSFVTGAVLVADGGYRLVL